MRKIIETAIGLLAVVAFIIVSASVVFTIAQAQTCETRCISKDLVTGECQAWQTDCY